jgi:DNA-binding transcriptional LysR family regulator
MDKLRCRQIYCHVVKEGNFSTVAKKLQLSKVMVSRAVSQLEEELGIRLLYRTTRKMSPTEEGLLYFERCQILLDDFNALDELVQGKHLTAKGRIRLAIPSEAFSINNLLSPIFSFMHDYPDVEFDIHSGDRYVDIVDDGFDVAIRIGDLEDSSHIARKLDNMNLVICASPEYLNKHKPIKNPSDLKSHSLLVDTVYRSGRSWVFNKGNDSITIKTNSHFKVNSPLIICEAIENGLGVGMCPSFVIQDKIKSGELVSVLDDWELMSGGVYAIYSHRLHLSTKVSLFVEHLIQHFK